MALITQPRSILGRKFSDSKLQKTIDALPYEVVNIGGEPQIRAAIPGVSQLLNPKYKYLAPEEITAKIIAKLKLVAERYYGYAVTHAVITVPSYFNDDQRQATKDACILAGLTCLRVLNEPIAAAMGHQLDRVDKEATHIVYNIGDEGIDVTLLDVDGGIFEILRSVHNSTLSSEGFDKMVLESVIQQSIDNKLIQSKTDIENIGTFEAEVKKAQDILMIDRSDVPDNAVIRLKTGGVRTSLNLTKAQVLSVQETLLKDSMRLFDRVLKMAKVTKSEVGHVVPVGKMSILKQAQPILKAYFEGKDKMLFSPEFDPDDAIVRGAASQGAILGGESGATGCTLMMDVNPLSLGIELTGGAYGKVVPRNTVIPTRKFVNITTVRHDQEKIVLNIYQGEEFYVMFNNLLGRLEIDVPKKPLGESVVELLFEIDVNYNLKVLARVLSSGKETRVDIPAGGNSRMSWLEMDKIITRAETHREYEKGLGESYAVAVRTNLDNLSWRDTGAAFVRSSSSEGIERAEIRVHNIQKFRMLANWLFTHYTRLTGY